jgi:hypothetical protein
LTGAKRREFKRAHFVPTEQRSVRPQAGEVSGRQIFWFLLDRLPKETRRASAATAKAFDFIREANSDKRF